ncbi:MAG: hypothetical protein ACREBR_03635 [bacterium]
MCCNDKHQEEVRREEIPNENASQCGMLVKNSNVVKLVGAHPRLGELLAQRVLEFCLLESSIGYGPASLQWWRSWHQ